jgi:hypothetical protein
MAPSLPLSRFSWLPLLLVLLCISRRGGRAGATGAIGVTGVVGAAPVDLSKLRNDEVALLQFDSRPLELYWKSAADWNNYYCALHGHKFIYYTSSTRCMHDDEPLHNAWCKVKAMLKANAEHKHIKLFIYMDSDAVISRVYVNTSVTTFLGTMQSKLMWDPDDRPMVFNQDGPCWWCQMTGRVGYTMCLNAGSLHDIV